MCRRQHRGVERSRTEQHHVTDLTRDYVTLGGSRHNLHSVDPRRSRNTGVSCVMFGRFTERTQPHVLPSVHFDQTFRRDP